MSDNLTGRALMRAVAEITCLRQQLKIAETALGEIKKYQDFGGEYEGCCPYGCDTPTIAQDALDQMKGGE